MLRCTIEIWRAGYWPRRVFALSVLVSHLVTEVIIADVPAVASGVIYLGLLVIGVPVNMVLGLTSLLLAAVVSWMIAPEFVHLPQSLIIPVSLTVGIAMLWWDWHAAQRRIAEDVHT